MPPAARIGDVHACPACSPTPHVGGPVTGGAATVIIGGLPAARVGDKAACAGGPDLVVSGSPTVNIAGKPAARVGDSLSHAGMIAVGCPTVFIGNAPGVGPREGGGIGAGGGPGTGPGKTPGDKTDGAGGKDKTATADGKKGPMTPEALAAEKKKAEQNLQFATFLGAPASMELIRAVLTLAAGLLADLAKHMAPGARDFLAAAIQSAKQTLALKQFAFLTEQLATVQQAMQGAVATVPAEHLKAAAEKAAESTSVPGAGEVVRSLTSKQPPSAPAGTSGRTAPVAEQPPGTPRPKLVISEVPPGKDG